MYKLKKYNQEQLLRYYDELDSKEKKELKKQINSIDYKLVNKAYIDSYTDEMIDINKVSSLKIIDKDNVNKEDSLIGEELIKNNEYAVLLMAGGFGSRLGLNKPKGCLELNINGKTITLYEIFINQLKEANKKYN